MLHRQGTGRAAPEPQVVDLRRAVLDEEVVAAAQVAVWALASEMPDRPWAILDRGGNLVACSDDRLGALTAIGAPVADIQLDDEDAWLTIATDAAGGDPGRQARTAARSVARLMHSIVMTSTRRRRAEVDADQARAAANLDPVTNVFNARGLWEALSVPPWSRAVNGDVSVARIAVEDLKAINREHGYLHGDLLLRTVAQKIEGCLRSGDVVARLGGAEFVALAHEIGPEELAARLRRAVDAEDVTVWVGVAQQDADEPIRTTVARADLDLRQQRIAGPPS